MRQIKYLLFSIITIFSTAAILGSCSSNHSCDNPGCPHYKPTVGCTQPCQFSKGEMARFKVIDKNCTVYRVEQNNDCSCTYSVDYFNDYGEKKATSYVAEYELVKAE